MSRPEDRHTSTVDGAAAFERQYGEVPAVEKPDLADVIDMLPRGVCEECRALDDLRDGLCRQCWEPPVCPGCGMDAGHRGRCV